MKYPIYNKKNNLMKRHIFFNIKKFHFEQDTSAIAFDNFLDILLQRNVSDFLKFQ